LKLYNFEGTLIFIQMNPYLIAPLEKLSQSTTVLFNKLANTNLEILQKKPTENGWSVIQVINHLIMSETQSLMYLTKKINGIGEVNDRQWTDFYKIPLMRLSMSGRIRFKAPKFVSNPSNVETLDEVKEKWNNQREKFRQFLDEFPDEHMEKKIFRHPFAGRITLLQTILFFNFHLYHHQTQIDRILKAING